MAEVDAVLGDREGVAGLVRLALSSRRWVLEQVSTAIG